MSHSWVVKVATPDQRDQVAATVDQGFCSPPSPGDQDLLEHAIGEQAVLVAHSEGDSSQVLGTSMMFPISLAMPRGLVAESIVVQGITGVAARQDHRRKGILRALMGHMLADAARQGQPWSVLTSTEPGIYGRFGFGHAAACWDFDLGSGSVSLSDDELAGCEYTIVSRDDGLPIHRQVWQESLAVYPGSVMLPEWKVDCDTRRYEPYHSGSPVLECAVVRRDGKPVAASLNTVTRDGRSATQTAKAPVPVDDAARKVLAYYLCSRDLVSKTRIYYSGTDDVLLWAAGGPDRTSARQEDGLLIRPVDLQKALASLQWGRPFTGVIELTDPVPGTAAKVAVQASGDGTVEVEPTDADADLSMSAETLGMMSLGDITYRSMRHRGAYTERRDGVFADCVAALRGLGCPGFVIGF